MFETLRSTPRQNVLSKNMLEETTNSNTMTTARGEMMVNAYEAARDLRVPKHRADEIDYRGCKDEWKQSSGSHKPKERLVGVAFIRESENAGNLAVQTTDVVARAR